MIKNIDIKYDENYKVLNSITDKQKHDIVSSLIDCIIFSFIKKTEKLNALNNVKLRIKNENNEELMHRTMLLIAANCEEIVSMRAYFELIKNIVPEFDITGYIKTCDAYQDIIDHVFPDSGTLK